MSAAPPRLMTAEDLGPLSNATPGRQIAYGEDPFQFGELSLPAGPGPHPVVINVHGGAWLDRFGLDHSRAHAAALADEGLAVWNIEYRRVGNPGGGWPGTFLDVAAAADYVRELAVEHSLDLSRVAAVGHSAGGHLALWLGARRLLPPDCPLYTPHPLSLRGIVALAPATDLETLHRMAIRDHVVDRLMGGSPQEVPERYDWAMPSRLMPLGIRQYVLVGRHDAEWGHNSESYAEAARRAGDRDVELIVIEDAGHFELIAPPSQAWLTALDCIRAVVQ